MTEQARRPRAAQVVDGNALAGVLDALRAHDPDTLVVECGGCGTAAPLATWVVESDPTADIVRCRTCTRTLWTVLRDGDAVTLRIARGCSIRTP